MEIQQSPEYASYIKSLKWVVEQVDGSYVFIKPFPVIGGFAKIQRSARLPDPDRLAPVLARNRVRTLAVEPDAAVTQKALDTWLRRLPRNVRLSTDPFIPSKTIRVDLTAPEEAIFGRFTEAKRRAVRRAMKHGVIVTASRDIGTLVAIKNKSAGFMGFITTSGIKQLWNTLPDKNKDILLAHTPTDELVGGVMLIYWDRTAYYWIAGAIPKGKKLFAPTLLVWESFKRSKYNGCRAFDFVGVWDERLPKNNTEWKGFTKFKEGFGGEPLYYPNAGLTPLHTAPVTG